MKNKYISIYGEWIFSLEMILLPRALLNTSNKVGIWVTLFFWFSNHNTDVIKIIYLVTLKSIVFNIAPANLL